MARWGYKRKSGASGGGGGSATRTLLANDQLADLAGFAVSNNLESDGAGAIRNTASGLNSFATDHADVPDVCDCMLEIEVAIGAAGGGGKRLGVIARHRTNALMAIAYLEWDGALFTARAGTFAAVSAAVNLGGGAHPGVGVVRWLRAMFFGDQIRWAYYTADPADGFPDAVTIGRVDLEAVDAVNCERVGGGCHGPVGIYLLDQGAGGSGYRIRNFKAWAGS